MPSAATTMPGAMPPVPRVRPGSNRTRPRSSVFLVASTSLLRATSRISTPATGFAEVSDRTSTVTPSPPDRAVRPRSETMNHCVARLS